MKNLMVCLCFLGVGVLVGYSARDWRAPTVIAQTPQAAEPRPIATPTWTPDLQGDVNEDGALNLSDAIYIIDYLVRGGQPMPPMRWTGPRLPVTGQKHCWAGTQGQLQDPCPAPGEVDHGQDAQYIDEAGYQHDFEIVKVDEADPMTWITIDHGTGLMWQYSDDRNRRIWRDALQYVEDLELGGLTDWRMPNAIELFSIMNAGSTDETGEPDKISYTEFFSMGASVYWSSTTCIFDASRAFTVRFDRGIQMVNCSDKGGQQQGGSKFRTLAVRSLE